MKATCHIMTSSTRRVEAFKPEKEGAKETGRSKLETMLEAPRAFIRYAVALWR